MTQKKLRALMDYEYLCAVFVVARGKAKQSKLGLLRFARKDGGLHIYSLHLLNGTASFCVEAVGGQGRMYCCNQSNHSCPSG